MIIFQVFLIYFLVFACCDEWHAYSKNKVVDLAKCGELGF